MSASALDPLCLHALCHALTMTTPAPKCGPRRKRRRSVGLEHACGQSGAWLGPIKLATTRQLPLVFLLCDAQWKRNFGRADWIGRENQMSACGRAFQCVRVAAATSWIGDQQAGWRLSARIASEASWRRASRAAQILRTALPFKRQCSTAVAPKSPLVLRSDRHVIPSRLSSSLFGFLASLRPSQRWSELTCKTGGKGFGAPRRNGLHHLNERPVLSKRGGEKIENLPCAPLLCAL